MLDNVTINQLRAFVAVCDQGSFSGAARELNRAQSAVSHAIKALESAFDVQLFERNTRKATLTAAGRSLLPDARAVISHTEEMKTRAASIAEAGVPQVSIAVDTYFPRAHLIECLRTLQADFSTVAINLRMTTMQGGERLVLEGTCALAVTITDVPELSSPDHRRVRRGLLVPLRTLRRGKSPSLNPARGPREWCITCGF
jgi:DNA-binding transcriptional LysR family regulator